MTLSIRRRDLLKSAGCGFGYLALASLAAEQAARGAGTGQPAGAPSAALPGEGEAGDLPVHAGGSEPGRFVRLQAPARSRRRQEPELRRRPRHRQHGHARLVATSHEAALEVLAARPVRPLGVGPVPRDQQARR